MVSKNAVTPGFALACFRASLMTLVSIKYMRGEFGRFNPLEIFVETDVGHRRQNHSQGAPARTRSAASELRDFGLRASAMRSGALLERPYDLVTNSAHQQIGHYCAPTQCYQ